MGCRRLAEAMMWMGRKGDEVLAQQMQVEGWLCETGRQSCWGVTKRAAEFLPDPRGGRGSHLSTFDKAAAETGRSSSLILPSTPKTLTSTMCTGNYAVTKGLMRASPGFEGLMAIKFSCSDYSGCQHTFWGHYEDIGSATVPSAGMPRGLGR